MDRLRLDYQRRDVPLPRAGLGVLLLALALAAGIGARYVDLSRKLADAEASADQLESTAHKRGIIVSRDAKDNAARGEEVRYANEVLRQLTLPWDRLFETIEASGEKNVALLSLAPDRQKHVVLIGIEARDPAAGLDYLKGLEARDIFRTVRVKSHSIQLQDPERPIRFTLQAAWKDAP